jgi:hypothetical protein
MILFCAKQHAMRTIGGVEVKLHHSWPRYYMAVSGQIHALGALIRGGGGKSPR